jgi:hypothetical protein
MKRLTATVPGEPNPEFTKLAGEDRIATTMRALEANGIATSVVANGVEAKARVLDMLPDGAEVFTSTSTTLDTISLSGAINASPHFQAVHPMVLKMDRASEGRQIRKLRAGPDWIVGSCHAITEQGQILAASASGSQLGPYAWTSAKVIFVAGTQKLVADLDEAMRRIEEYAWPLENQRSMRVYGEPSSMRKVLIINREDNPGRISMILVREKLGF